MSKIEKKWLPVSHFGFFTCIAKFVIYVTPNTLFNITAKAIMQGF